MHGVLSASRSYSAAMAPDRCRKALPFAQLATCESPIWYMRETQLCSSVQLSYEHVLAWSTTGKVLQHAPLARTASMGLLVVQWYEASAAAAGCAAC